MKFELKKIIECATGPAVLFISSEHFSESTNELYKKIADKAKEDFSLYELIVYNWDDMLTPWPSEADFNGRKFSGNASELLENIESEVIPNIQSCHDEEIKIYIAGYSLAGLFSLWSIYKSDVFSGAVCCSGSLWYPGFYDFVQKKEFGHSVYIYLSLGDREEYTKNVLMRTVGDNTKKIHNHLKNDLAVSDVVYEINAGGHFTDVTERTAKGIGWIISKGR